MKILKYGSRGPAVQLLQLGLSRAGYGELKTDGIFGPATKNALVRFQQNMGLSADGVAGPVTQRVLRPYYTGYLIHLIRPGDTLYSISRIYGADLAAITAANPTAAAGNLRPGAALTVPLPFDIVPTTIDYTSTLVSYCVQGLAARYPALALGEAGRSVMGTPLWYLRAGTGQNRVLYNATHHANEWITTPVLLKFAEDLCKACTSGGNIFGQSAREMLTTSSIYIFPAVNPDGMDLVTGELQSGTYYDYARAISARYPQYPFPSGWKANIRGVDLNLQYPAGWEKARENKEALGVVSPAPADYVGPSPLYAPESRAMYDFTLALDPALTLSYHTQGNVIYWRFQDYEPKNAKKIAETFAAVSGYAVEETPYASAFAGYKDWFIQQYDRPGYTIECGRGENPLPISDFDRIYADNLGILTMGAVVTV